MSFVIEYNQGVDNSFRTVCFWAQQGGSEGYRGVGEFFMDFLLAYFPEKASDLDAIVSREDSSVTRRRIMQWIKREFPAYGQWVPYKRRKRFIEGLVGL